MRLISLNTWGGRVREPLVSFVKRYAGETDIFCFQEVYSTQATVEVIDGARARLFSELSTLLPEHEGHHVSVEDNFGESGKTDFDIGYGLALFARKGLLSGTCESIFVHKEKGAGRSENGYSAPRAIQQACITSSGKQYSIINFHGLHTGTGKEDTQERLVQSQNILAFLAKNDMPTILCGDFNLLPDTESLAMIERAGMRNLIKEYGITSTRTEFYTRPVKFADYALVSKEITVRDFKVLPDAVSDHAPLYLEFE